MRKLFTLFALATPCLLYAQANPGNVGTTNLTAWFKAGDLAAGNVTAWNTAYPAAGLTLSPIASTGPYPVATATPAGNVSNYNTTVDMTGSTDANNLGLVYTTTGLNLLNNASSTAQGTVFILYHIPDPNVTISNTGQHIMQYREANSGGDGIQTRRLAATNRIAIGSSGNVNATRDYTETFRPTILSYSGNYLSTMVASQSNRVIPAATVASASSGYTGLYIGTRRNQTSGNYEGSLPGYISEVIFYNTNLPATDMAKVNSYLAIKYGITLDNSIVALGGSGSYVSSAGATIWNATVNPGYHNDIIGIGRDDDQGLLQKQSHALDDSARLYVGTLSATNSGNSGTITTDKSFVLAGHNTDPLCNANASTEYPVGNGIISRIDREWKITNSSFVNSFSMDITLNGCGNFSSTTIANLRLLVDYDDGNFTNASVFSSSSGISFSLVGNVLKVSNISNAQIPASSTAYITIAAASSPLATYSIDLSAQLLGNHQVQLNWMTDVTNAYTRFDVEKSADGKEWYALQSVAANNTDGHYTATDTRAEGQKNYYRVKAVNRENNSFYSATRAVTLNVAGTGYRVYPNPAGDELTVDLQQDQDGELQLYNLTGRQVYTQSITSKTAKILIDTRALQDGVYYLRISSAGQSSIQKILVQHQ